MNSLVALIADTHFGSNNDNLTKLNNARKLKWNLQR